jgi:Zn-dependent protease
VPAIIVGTATISCVASVPMGADEHPQQPPPSPPRPGALRVARIFGVPVYITISWIVLAVLIIVGYGPYIGGGTSGPVAYALGASIVVFLLVSVLLHELGHAAVARRYRVRVRGITLELLGGFTEMDGDAPSPRAEAAIALAGPAVSFALALIALAFVPLTTRGTIVGDLTLQLAAANALVAVFNVLPGLPLDGGRALRAGIWGATHDPHRADVIAGWCGRVIAMATLLGGVALYAVIRSVSFISVIFLVLVALTLWNGASESIRVADVKRRLPLVRAGAMARPLHLVPSGTPLAEALRQRDERNPGGQSTLGVSDSAGRVIALVSGRAAAAVPLGRRPWVDVDSVARAVAPQQRISADSTGMAVLEAVQANPGNDLLVTVGEDVVGVLRVQDVITMLESRGPRP